MEEAVYRLKLAADAGADVCFIEGVKNKELLEQTVAALAPKPVSTFPRSSSATTFDRFLLGTGECHLRWPHAFVYKLGGGGNGSEDHQ